MDIISKLPTVEAILNIFSASCLLSGYYFIRNRNIRAHFISMCGALFFSSIFIVVYLIYHLNIGNIPFAGTGIIRPVYFTILASHIILAASICIPVILTLLMIISGNKKRHRQLGRWIVPIWLYVSVTGVIIYLMAFHFYPPPN